MKQMTLVSNTKFVQLPLDGPHEKVSLFAARWRWRFLCFDLSPAGVVCETSARWQHLSSTSMFLLFSCGNERFIIIEFLFVFVVFVVCVVLSDWTRLAVQSSLTITAITGQITAD